MSRFDADKHSRRTGSRYGDQVQRQDHAARSGQPSPGKLTRVALETGRAPSRERSGIAPAPATQPASREIAPAKTELGHALHSWEPAAERTYQRDNLLSDRAHAASGAEAIFDATPDALLVASQRNARSLKPEDAVPLADTARAAVARSFVPRSLSLESPSEPPQHAATSDDYIAVHRSSVIASVREWLHQAGLPAPRAGSLVWSSDDIAIDEIVRALDAHIADSPLQNLVALTRCQDLRAIVDWGRASPGTQWQPEVGWMIAEKLDAAIRDSIERMGLEVWSGFHVNARMPSMAELDVQIPLDRVIGSVLVRPGMVRFAATTSSLTASPLVPSGPRKLPDEVRGELEQATGRSLDHVRVHTGAEGDTIAKAHDARAVTIGGSDIYMAAGQFDPISGEGRELIAHEVAHVVQAEVHPGTHTVAAKRDTDASTDAAEAEADAFAARFRAQGAAAKWTPLATISTAPAMRAPATPASARSATRLTAPLYVNKYIVKVVGAIRDRIHAVSLVHPHPRLYWSSLQAAQTAVSAAILRYAQSGGDASLKMLMKLAFPRDLVAVVERMRAGISGSDWDPAVGIAIANEMMEPLEQSIRRMGERLRVQLDESATMPRASELVAECAMDGLVAEVLCQRGMVMPDMKKRAKGDDTHGKPFLHGAREVEWEPVGDRDPKLWNFIKVTSPKNPTAADVAKTPLMGGEVLDGSEQAHRIHASPPYFGIPIETAKNVPELVRHAPLDMKARLGKGDLGPRVADGAPLAKSAVSDDVALAQAPAARKGAPRPERLLERIDEQLAFLWKRMARWHIAAELVGATLFVERRKAELVADLKAVERWHGALAAMEAVLYYAAREAIEILDELEKKVSPAEAQHAQPNVRVLEAYARAAGVSHLPSEGRAALAEARKLRALLPIALAEESIRRAHASLHEQQVAEHQAGAAPAPTVVDPRVSALGTRAADLRLEVARRGVLDADAAEQLAIDTDEVAVRARIATIQVLVKHVEQRADALGMSPAVFSSGLPTVRALLKELLHTRIPRWLDRLDRADDWRGPTPGRSPAQTILAQRRAAISGVAAAITAFNKEVDLEKWLQWAHERLDDEQLRQRLSRLALEMGIMIVTGQVGGAVVAGLRGFAIGADLMASARGAGLAWKAAEIALHAGLATGAQGAMGGELSGKAFVQNALAIGFTSAALRPFEGLFAETAKVEADIAKTWARIAKQGGKVVAASAIDLAAGIGASAVADGLVGHGAQGVGNVLEQGIAVAASHFVAQRTRRMHQRIMEASRDFGALRRLDALLADVDALQRRAEKGAKTPEEAQALLAESHRALVEERRLYQELVGSQDPRAKQAALAGLKAVEADTRANLVDASLRLSGLDPVVDGHVYEGSRAAIERAIEAAKASNEGLRHTFDQKTRTHTIVAGAKTFTLHEVGTTQHALGRAIAEKVAGVTYREGGTFVIAADHGNYEVSIRRTSGPAGNHREGNHRFVIEIPKGATGAELERHVIEQLEAVRFKTIWPGEVPEWLSGAQKQIFVEARKVFEKFKNDPARFQGPSAGRIQWTRYLVERGIPLEGIRYGGTHEIYEHTSPTRPVPASDVALPAERSMGTRSKNTAHVKPESCLAALGEIVAHGSVLAGAKVQGNVIKVPLGDGRTWTITVAEPMPTEPGRMAALKHGERGDTVWVSDTLTNEQVPRALGAIISESIARAGGRGHGHAARFGELDAMFAHRESVAKQAPPKPSGRTPDDKLRHAIQASQAESTARIDAEIDLVLLRLGIHESGPRREEVLASMPPALAAKVRARFDQQIAFNKGAIIPASEVAQPTKARTTTLATSEVFPDAPAHVRPFSEADHALVVELRVELEIIKEIDARLALRDQPGMNGGRADAERNDPLSSQIARGETRRRVEHVARARELLAQLQLGGGDRAYLEVRLQELARVFPGVERDVVPAIQQRIERRASAEAAHAEAEAFRIKRNEQAAVYAQRVLGGKPFTTQRLVVGDGISALADVATLGVEKRGAWIDPADMLVVGGRDLFARLDPAELWGQRAAVYNRAKDGHPAFEGGELARAVEDPGNFMHMGELRDATDLARKRLGVAPVEGEVLQVETKASATADSPPWEVDASKFPVRALVSIQGQKVYVYAAYADLMPGPGKPRMPDEQILSREDRKALMKDQRLVSGDKIVEGMEVKGLRVLVLAFGPTGAWTAVAAARGGARRVDFAGAAGGEMGTALDKRFRLERGDTASNDSSMRDLAKLDRVQDALEGNPNIHITMDRVVHIEPKGKGAVVTYAHGPGENVELYQVEYDLIATTMGFSNNFVDPTLGGPPTVKEMIGEMKMAPQRGTDAPVLEDESGRVRVMGIAAADATNVRDRRELARRQDELSLASSADSPDFRVVEGTGIAARMANRKNAKERSR